MCVFSIPLSARAAVTDGAPDQASCSSGSTTYTWNSLGIARPVIASMTVDGETVTDPTNPLAGSIGAAVCANVELGRRTGLYVYYHVDGSTNRMDLTGALTPAGNPITSSSKITITMTNMGDLAKYFSFSLVHGTVSSWTTANLGTNSASLVFTFSPTRTPFGSGSDFGFCTATPPNCSAAKSDADGLSASLDMTFDQNGYGSSFAGAYFALTGAMGGWVESTTAEDGTKSLVATLGAPHMLADGITANVGSMQAFLPDSVITGLLGLTSGTLDTSTLAISRTESGATTSGIPFTVTAVTGGVIVTVTDITFSSPAYKLAAAAKTDAPFTLTSLGTVTYSSKIDQYYYTGHRPTFSGTTTAGSDVTVTIHSDPITCKTKASSSGKWSCALSQDIPDGDHTVLLAVVTPTGGTNSISFKLGINTGLAATGNNSLPFSLVGGLGALCVAYLLYRTRRG
jgi:hypothetical protein